MDTSPHRTAFNIWTEEGWIYLTVVNDLFTREVIGFAMGQRMTWRLAMNA